MENYTITIKMEVNNDLRRSLKDLGFTEVKHNLFSKQISNTVTIYRDYRNDFASSYAYSKTTPIDAYNFKEIKAIQKIEKHLISESRGELLNYI